VLVIAWELIWNKPSVDIQPVFLPFMAWVICSWLCGLYCTKHGGGGPGLETPADRLVSTGPYAYSRNPMYLGHLIYLLGLSLTLRSWLGAVITIAVALWFRRRVIGDEKNLATRLGKPYLEYMKKVPCWI
jgi:protein-S-isoprenylcysteine O-methyltransferase Ste14